MQTALYLRVSSTAQADANGVDAQRAECLRWCSAYGIAPTEYTDLGITGSHQDRPEWLRLLADCRAGRVQRVVAYSMSRISRSARDLLSIFAELESLGVQVVLVKEQIDSSTPAGRLMRTILAALCEYEREVTGSRIQDGVRRARANGKRWGFGHTQPTGGDPAVMAEGLAMARRGLGPTEIARELGVHRTTVHRWVRALEGKAI